MKTTVLGVLSILVAVANAALAFLKGAPVDYAATVSAITVGLGLIKAADANPKS